MILMKMCFCSREASFYLRYFCKNLQTQTGCICIRNTSFNKCLGLFELFFVYKDICKINKLYLQMFS